MSNTQHTPGPWVIADGVSPRVYLINNRTGNAIGEVVYCDTRNPHDARLIAAAPELLAALQHILAANLTIEQRAIVCKAIAKAEGSDD